MAKSKDNITITKFDEQIFTTSVLEEMKGLYLAERLLRTWKEDFVDEDTGEVVQIERKEQLFSKGTLLDSSTLSQLNFFLQSGDIKEVKVSNQQREAQRAFGYASLWQSQIILNSKKKTLYLYANSVEMAIAITEDYIEQKYQGSFDLKLLKELDYSNLLSESNSEKEQELDELDVYKMEIELVEDGERYNSSYVVHGTDAEDCKKIIHDYIMKIRIKENRNIEFELKIISAKTIPCNYIIDAEFCKKYLENKP
jgi:hypothetical protein